MLDIMSQAKNAIESYNAALRIHSANIANMNVIGYKKLDYSFQSIFEKILQRGTAADIYEGLGGTNPMQLGQGMAIANVSVDFSQGSLASGGTLDLAIIGQGLFIVSPDGGETFLYSRSGQFYLQDGNLLNKNGMQVYGIDTTTGQLAPITGITSTTFDLTKLSWTDDGILAEFSDPAIWNTVSKYSNFKIALTYFDNPTGLEQSIGTTFRRTLASGEPASAIAPNGVAGSVTPRNNEQSNVFYLGETIDSLEIQRAMSGNLTVIRMASDTIQQFINRLG